jgi:7,8-didemethyl-8-hydroxy-5-deazariboflavin synthase CofG subunit
MQNFQPKVGTGMEKFASPSLEYFLKAVAMARIVMPNMNIQVPPNLNPNIFGKFIDCGINDWGGISPVTIDHVNPEFAWPTIESVENVTRGRGYNLRARLPVYPEFLHKDNGFISNHLKEYIYSLSDSSGLVREEYVN